MRLHLTIQRHGLPVTRILWTTSPPSLFGHNHASSSSMIPATSSAVTSSRVPNALYANGGYTVAHLLEDVNEVIPLETEPRLFEDESSGQWGLEDYVVEVGGSECLHFMEVDGLLREGDEVLIRALQISDLRARRLSGRHQISMDGKHLIDGVPFGKPFLKRPTSSRPAITIPPRKKRRTALSIWGSGSSYEEEDTEWAPPQQISTGKELSLLNPASGLEKEDDDDEDEYEDAYRDDYEDYHEPNEDGDGTVIRHNIDRTLEGAEDDHQGSDGVVEDLSQELQDLKKDMEAPLVPKEGNATKREKSRSQSLRSRLSTLQAVPRKSSLSRPSMRRSSDASRRDSKSVTFDQQKQDSPKVNVETALARAGSTSEEPEDVMSSESDSSSSASDSVVSESSDEEEEEEEEIDLSSASSSVSEAASESSSESDSDSSSESSPSESESESEAESEADSGKEDVADTSNILKPTHNMNPPGAGSLRTRKSNQRCKLRRRLTKLKELGILDKAADFAALRQWEAEHGDSFYVPGAVIDLKAKAQEEFEAKRQKLLLDLESGGVDITPYSEKENVTPTPVEHDVSELPEDHDEQYETANDTNEASPEVPQRRTLDVASTRRLLFGSLGVRAPRSKEEEEATRRKLAGKAQKFIPQKTTQNVPEDHETESEVDWREKLILGATECFYDDIELSTPPFPFEQRWDPEATELIRQRKQRGKKRKRRQQVQEYDEEENTGYDYYGEEDTQLNYDDSEFPEAQIDDKVESEQAAFKSVESTIDDLPALPSDTSGLAGVTAQEMKPGLVFAFKQLDVSRATNWQPTVSEFRVAVVTDVFDNNILGIRLAKPYRREPKTDDDEGPFQYSGFEMPGMDDEEGEDDGFREVPFDDLIDPKLLRAAPTADAGDQDTASILPAGEEPPAPEPSQSAVDDAVLVSEHGEDQLAAISSQKPSSPIIDRISTSNFVTHPDSPVQSPRFEGFEPASSPPSSPASGPSLAASSNKRHDEDEEQRAPSTPKEKHGNEQSELPSTCPPNADDHDQQESGLTDQLQPISTPSDMGSFNRVLDYLASQDPSSPIGNSVKSERKGSPYKPSPEISSPTVPTPFYDVDKLEERRRLARIDRKNGRASSKRQPLKVEVPSSPEFARKSSRKSSPSTQDPSLASVVPDSVQPPARNESPPVSQVSEHFIDLTQSSPPVSPAGSDKDYAKTHPLPRGPGWVSKNFPRRQTRQSSQSSRIVQTLNTGSISPPRRR